MTKIKTPRQYYAIMRRIDELLQVVDDDTPEDDIRSVELMMLSDLVADYEDEHYPIPSPSLVDVIKLRMFEMGLNQSTLAARLGMNQSKVSEIMSGKCEPTLKQARIIAKELDISPSIVLGV